MEPDRLLTDLLESSTRDSKPIGEGADGLTVERRVNVRVKAYLVTGRNDLLH